jgi:hypothetical protein
MWETAAFNDKAERLRAEQGVSPGGHELMTKKLGVQQRCFAWLLN